MTTLPPSPADLVQRRTPLDALDRFCRAVLSAAGADNATADAATRAMMHGSRLGVDSHGVRLLIHYVTVLETGRLNPRPHPRVLDAFGAVAALDGDNGHGALATYRAMDHAVGLAQTMGIGAVAIRNSEHFGPAGAYALAAAEAGCIGMCVCNTDRFVRLHEGASPVHGTNPIAVGVPTGGENPWLFDMATSAIPYNRVLLSRSLGRTLPAGVASAPDGEDTTDPDKATMLTPVGGEFSYKGAGIAGFVEILSGVFTGMKLSFDILPMMGSDMSTPRGLGAFVMAIKADAVVDMPSFHAAMQRYLETLRSSPARAGGKVLAPGDREWAEAARRKVEGVPIDPDTDEAFKELGARYGIEPPRSVQP